MALVATGSETPNISLTINELASSFMGKVEQQPKDQFTIDSTKEVVDSEEEQEGTDLSQSDDDSDKKTESDDSYFFRISK